MPPGRGRREGNRPPCRGRQDIGGPPRAAHRGGRPGKNRPPRVRARPCAPRWPSAEGGRHSGRCRPARSTCTGAPATSAHSARRRTAVCRPSLARPESGRDRPGFISRLGFISHAIVPQQRIDARFAAAERAERVDGRPTASRRQDLGEKAIARVPGRTGRVPRRPRSSPPTAPPPTWSRNSPPHNHSNMELNEGR
jgi:hypothetical protein